MIITSSIVKNKFVTVNRWYLSKKHGNKYRNKKNKTSTIQNRRFKGICKYINTTRNFKYIPEDIMTIEQTKKIILWYIERDVKNSISNFMETNLAVILKSNDSIIGWCGLQSFDPYPDEIEIFYGLSKNYWNRGYITEAAKVVVQYGFQNLLLEKIVAGVKPNNIASIKILEKIGFKFVRTLNNIPADNGFYNGEYYFEINGY